jgi:hypothetical protein
MERQQTPQSDVAQAEQPETHVDSHEIAEEPNLSELRNYLAQYGEMIVESPRLPGVPLPLQALINACPKDPTEETAPEFLAEAKALVATAQSKELELEPEDEETKEEAEAKEDSDTQAAKKKLI